MKTTTYTITFNTVAIGMAEILDPKSLKVTSDNPDQIELLSKLNELHLNAGPDGGGFEAYADDIDEEFAVDSGISFEDIRPLIS